MKLTRTIISRIWWLGRGTATVMGLAMLLALTVGLTSTALAGTGVGARFSLGKINVVNDATTALQGSGPSSGTGPLLEVKREGTNTGSTLRVENTNTQSFAPALQLKVPTGKIPMTVSTNAGTAVGLSADELDGKESSDFASATNGKAKDAFNADFASFAGDAQNAQFAADANNLDGRDASGFANGTNGKANDADRLDGKDSTQIGVNGLQRVSVQSEFGSDFEHRATANCPAGKVVVGTGYKVFGDSFSGFADNIQVAEVTPTDRTVEVVAWEDESTDMGWGVKATAICATAP